MRINAINTINKVVFGHHSLSNSLDKNAKPIEKEICYGVLRHYFFLEEILNKLLAKKLKEKDNDILTLLMIGVYELEFTKTPEFAVVNECVNTTIKLKKLWAKNLVNAILRNYLREKEKIKNNLTEEEFFSHPDWLVEKLKLHYPENWKNIIKSGEKRPPMTCRINLKTISREKYLEKFEIDADIFEEIPSAIILRKPILVSDLPGFNEGLISVQDAAAQFAPIFLDIKPGQRILDACAAPGGKTCHILESENNCEVIAIDVDEERIKKISENLFRLKLNAKLICADVTKTEEWWDKIFFDRILLDAPCSATGVIRRHPDIKLLREEEDIKNFALVQLEMLEKCWPLLKNSGILLYATCSILPEENSFVIQKFLEKNNSAKLKFEKQILTGEKNMDGFFYAAIEKISGE